MKASKGISWSLLLGALMLVALGIPAFGAAVNAPGGDLDSSGDFSQWTASSAALNTNGTWLSYGGTGNHAVIQPGGYIEQQLTPAAIAGQVYGLTAAFSALAAGGNVLLEVWQGGSPLSGGIGWPTPSNGSWNVGWATSAAVTTGALTARLTNTGSTEVGVDAIAYIVPDAAVPEPLSMSLVGGGLIGLAAFGLRRRK